MADDFDRLASKLRASARSNDAHVRAAVELLIWHESWLRRPDFVTDCVRVYGSGTVISWSNARRFFASGPQGSTSALALLDLAVALGENRYRLDVFGHSHRRAVAEAFAAAVGLRLDPPIPEAGHSHPDFIPGDPATCHRCALEANRDEVTPDAD